MWCLQRRSSGSQCPHLSTTLALLHCLHCLHCLHWIFLCFQAQTNFGVSAWRSRSHVALLISIAPCAIVTIWCWLLTAQCCFYFELVNRFRVMLLVISNTRPHLVGGGRGWCWARLGPDTGTARTAPPGHRHHLGPPPPPPGPRPGWCWRWLTWSCGCWRCWCWCWCPRWPGWTPTWRTAAASSSASLSCSPLQGCGHGHNTDFAL